MRRLRLADLLMLALALCIGPLAATRAVSAQQASTPRTTPPAAQEEKQANSRASELRNRLIGWVSSFWTDFRDPRRGAPGDGSDPSGSGAGGDGAGGTSGGASGGATAGASGSGAGGRGRVGGLGGSGAGGANAGGSGSGGADGGDTGMNPRIGFDDNARRNGGGNGNPPRGDTGGGDATRQGKAFPQWYPMCLFIDTSAVPEAAANATIKGMVAAMAKCDVNLVVFPVAVRPGSYPGEATDHGPESGQINAAQSAACNIAGNVDNATRASTSMCTGAQKMSDQMCGQYRPLPPPATGETLKTETAGCAQVNSSPAEKSYVDGQMNALRARAYPPDGSPGDAAAQKRLQDIEGHNKGGGANNSSSSIAPSIEDSGACTTATVSHEAIGHSMFGHPNGAEDGFGIGFQEGASADGWSDSGCAAIRRNAFLNNGRWKYDPNRNTYMTYPRDPSLLYDLSSARPLFGGRNNPPPPGAPRPPQVTGGPQRIGFDDDAPRIMAGGAPATTQPPATGGAARPSQPAPVDDDERHRRRQGALLATLNPPGAGSSAANTYQSKVDVDGTSANPGVPQKFAGDPPGKPSARIGFADDTPKALAGVGSAVGQIPRGKVDQMPGEMTFAAGEAGSAGRGKRVGLGYDDDAQKNSAVAGLTVGGKPTGARLGYDDDAPKNAAGASGFVGMVAGGSRPDASGALSGGPGFSRGPTILSLANQKPSGLDSNFFQKAGGGGGDDDEEDETVVRKKRLPGAALRPGTAVDVGLRARPGATRVVGKGEKR